MKKYLHAIYIVIIIGIFGLVTGWMLSTPVTAKVETKKFTPFPVSVVTVTSSEHEAFVQAFGKAAPYWKTDIVAAVSGRVTELTSEFDAGKRMDKGTLLAKVEDISYRSEVAARKRELADAKLAYVQEKRQVLQAKKDWKRLGNTEKPSSPLVFRQPQLEAAAARVKAAENALSKAQNDYRNTKITAPYNAAVIERKVALGTYVSAGTVVGSIYGTDRMEVRFPLTEEQCSQLRFHSLAKGKSTKQKLSVIGTKVQMVSVTNSANKWIGTVTGMELLISGKTRQRMVIVSVDKPLEEAEPFFPGSFVRADIPAGTMPDSLALPESAFTQGGEVWFVNNEKKLQRIKPKVRFRRNGKIFFEAPEGMERLTVVVRPLNTYMTGTVVAPKESKFTNG